MKKIIIVFIALALTACSFGSQNERSRNQDKWQNANITYYQFELNVGCFCAFRSQMPVTVEVQNGKIDSIIAPDGTVITSDDPNYETISRYATMDRLFSELESDSVKGADEVTVTYDPTYGFPSEINIDFIKNAVDDELYLSASGFEKLP